MSTAQDILIPIELTPAEIERVIDALQFASEECDEPLLAKFEAKLEVLTATTGIMRDK